MSQSFGYVFFYHYHTIYAEKKSLNKIECHFKYEKYGQFYNIEWWQLLWPCFRQWTIIRDTYSHSDFNIWVWWLCCVNRIVPKDIHNTVAIMLLVSGLLTCYTCICYIRLFLHHNRFCINIIQFSASYLPFQHLYDRGGRHAWGRVYLLFPEHLVPLAILVIKIAHVHIWEVVLANAHSSWGTCMFLIYLSWNKPI